MTIEESIKALTIEEIFFFTILYIVPYLVASCLSLLMVFLIQRRSDKKFSIEIGFLSIFVGAPIVWLCNYFLWNVVTDIKHMHLIYVVTGGIGLSGFIFIFNIVVTFITIPMVYYLIKPLIKALVHKLKTIELY